jgi:hypothetical protein
MCMIGHNPLCIENHAAVSLRNPIPFRNDHFSSIVENHFIVHHIAKSFNSVIELPPDTHKNILGFRPVRSVE